GVYAPGGRQTFMLDSPREVGHVSVISQSGGLAGDIVKAGNERGLRYSKLVTVGNAIDVAPGELLEAFVDDADTKVVGMYLEGARDAERLVAALRALNRNRKPVALLVGGLSRQGAHAVASHTGSLAGDHRVWEAVSAATGATVTTTLEDFLAVLVYLQRYADHPGTGDGAVVVMGPGGGASVLATDACDRAGLEVAAGIAEGIPTYSSFDEAATAIAAAKRFARAR